MAVRQGSTAGRAATLGLFLAAVLVSVGLAEGVLRWTDYGVVLQGPAGRRVVLDPELLFRFLPSPAASINARGYRESHRFGARGEARRIVFHGDSFIMGWEGPLEHTLPKVLESVLGPAVEVYNLGVAADGPDQALLRLGRDGLTLAPDVVVFAVYAGNDFGDLLRNELFDAAPDGALVPNARNPVRRELPTWRLPLLARRLVRGATLDPARAEPLAERLFRDAALPVDESLGFRAAHLMEAVLRSARETVEAHGADFQIVVIPDLCAFGRLSAPVRDYCRRTGREPGDDRNERTMASLCRRAALPCVHLMPLFARQPLIEALYSPSGHLSHRGAHVSAALLARSVRSLLDPASPVTAVAERTDDVEAVAPPTPAGR